MRYPADHGQVISTAELLRRWRVLPLPLPVRGQPVTYLCDLLNEMGVYEY